MVYVLLEFLKFLLPLAGLIIALWLILKMFFARDAKQRIAEMESADRRNLVVLKTEQSKLITPVRLQAYERIILLLERITPDNLVMRMRRSDIGSGQMQGILLQTIRDEYDHNMSQQLYVSDEAWEMVKKAKEEVIQLINNAGAGVMEEETAIDLCRRILEHASAAETLPTVMAIQFLKSEIKKLF